MIDTDKYEEQLEDDNTDTWVVWRIAKESIEEVKRLREEVNTLNEIIDTERKKVYDIAQKLLEAIE